MLLIEPILLITIF